MSCISLRILNHSRLDGTLSAWYALHRAAGVDNSASQIPRLSLVTLGLPGCNRFPTSLAMPFLVVIAAVNIGLSGNIPVEIYFCPAN